MRPRTGRGWIQLSAGFLFLLLAALAIADINRTTMLSGMGLVATLALVYSSTDRGQHERFGDFLTRHHVRIPPAVAFLMIFFGVGTVWFFLGWLAR